MIEIDLNLLTKAEKRIWVKPTSKKKGHYRKIKGAKEEVAEVKDVKDSRDEIIHLYEKSIQKQEFESCGVFDDNGKLIFTKDGIKVKVTFMSDERDKFEGSILTHNHPVGESFSMADIGFGCSVKLKEIRVISKVGNRYSMKFKRLKGTSEKAPLVSWFGDVNEVYWEHYRAVEDEFIRAMNRDELSEADANFKFHNEVWKRVSKDVQGLEYRRL